MERKISSRNLGKTIEVSGFIFKEGKELYIVEGYAKAKILNPEIFKDKKPNYATIKGELTIYIKDDYKKAYPEFAIKVESYKI
ncbi:MAG TPA: hypothetical protein EYH56_01220 [Nanoarchaeota archaeon]|nr:hypothetical protein [Nanoarchaeota archaeon]